MSNVLASQLSKLPKAFLVDGWILSIDPSIKATGMVLFNPYGEVIQSRMAQVPITRVLPFLEVSQKWVRHILVIREYQRPFRGRKNGQVIRGGNSMIEAGNAIEREVKRLWPRKNHCFKVSPRTWQSACGCNITNNTKAHSISRLRADGFECSNKQDGMADAYNIGQWFLSQLRFARQITIAA